MWILRVTLRMIIWIGDPRTTDLSVPAVLFLPLSSRMRNVSGIERLHVVGDLPVDGGLAIEDSLESLSTAWCCCNGCLEAVPARVGVWHCGVGRSCTKGIALGAIFIIAVLV